LAQVQKDANGYFQRAMRRENAPTERIGWEMREFRKALIDRQPLVQLRILEKYRSRMREWYFAPERRFAGMARGEPAEDPAAASKR
jgi:hypothetical protein